MKLAKLTFNFLYITKMFKKGRFKVAFENVILAKRH